MHRTTPRQCGFVNPDQRNPYPREPYRPATSVLSPEQSGHPNSDVYAPDDVQRCKPSVTLGSPNRRPDAPARTASIAMIGGLQRHEVLEDRQAFFLAFLRVERRSEEVVPPAGGR